eukprot:TRINITY_DN46224_c0_g1_i1.p1 TRINITY_DN46224_c0_g1~~TRINITY_DN46224_c0_g1_i1.p1  ORF type:complete len:298 (-),score=27.23 TRINITY_DN46224_c0_g1_i1:239-1132(-)
MIVWLRRSIQYRARTYSTQIATFTEGKAGVVRCSPAEGVRRQTPLVFIHGICHGPWFWRGYQEQCAFAGYESYSVTLASSSLCLRSIVGKHAEDVWSALAENSVQSPVIIGHSLGGMIAQEMTQSERLQGRAVQGMVFMASKPRRGYTENCRFFMHLLQNAGFPAFVSLQNFASLTPDARAMHKLFFLPSTQETTLLGADARVTMEEYFAKLKTHDAGLGWLDFVPTSTEFLDVPKLVVVPLQDACIPVASQKRLATLAKAELMEIENMGHCIGDEGWERSICAPLIQWLNKNEPTE